MNRPYRRWQALLPLLLAALLAAPATAQIEPVIGELSLLDRQYMQRQRNELDDLARLNLGRQFRGDRDNDLELLQLLLDRRLVRDDQTELLQGMGFILGDLLAADLGMHWVIYEDELGRSRALRLQDSDNFLFPVTMISRRREAGSDTPVREVYRKAREIIEPLREPLPFQ